MFEQGPIRPPSEAGSLLIRFTRNCPWNRCSFCPVYKGQAFSRRTLKEICQDIDRVHEIVENLQALSHSMGHNGSLTHQVMHTVMTDPSYEAGQRHVASWLFSGKGTVFIQDADSLIMRTKTLTEALGFLKTKIPGVRRITSYARSSTLARKSLEDLRDLRKAGLDQIHIGLESGSDRVLELVNKGASARQHIEAGLKVINAGMTLSEYVMPGLGGRKHSEEHAVETARVLNAIDPHFIRLRSLRIPPRAPLHQDKARGDFVPLTDDETALEIRRMISSLEGIHTLLASDHIMNLLPEVEGVFPYDKKAMLAVIDRYMALPTEQKLLYRLGRRGGALGSLDDLQDPGMISRLEQAAKDLKAQLGMDLESIITDLGDQYI
jgi:histone acetyltransferase (RNA polymerase elongator complex component)